MSESCKSWLCHECIHYTKFLTLNSMRDICWNKNVSYETQEIHDFVDTSIEEKRLLDKIRNENRGTTNG